jgi:hypothetical protein
MRELIECETHRGFAGVTPAPNVKKRCGLTASQKFE